MPVQGEVGMRSVANLSIRTKIGTSFAAVLVIVASMGLYINVQIAALRQASDWNTHTYAVIESVDNVMAGMVGQETGLRGYLISADETFLEPYRAGVRQAAESWNRAKELTADNPEQQQRLEGLKSAIALWQEGIAQREIALMADPATVQQAREMEASGAGKAAFDALRGIAGEIREVEADLLAVRAAQQEAALEGSESATWIGMGVALALSVLLGVLLTRGISRPVHGITVAMGKLADGDKTLVVPFRGRRDEIGRMAEAVEVFKQNAIEMDRLQTEQEALKARAEEERKAAMLKLADSFELRVKGVVETVASAASQMQGAATAMSGTAEETSRQASAVASASEQATANVQTVATTAEELSSSIQEIGRQVEASARISGQAVQETQRTAESIAGLVEAAKQIEDVVGLINSIAGQTNLLALNATIEAARAGEAGKGFAVVASEVKALATQTARATEEIQVKVSEIQSATGGARTAMDGIGGTIARMSEISGAIAAAVEEQGAATRDISSNVQQAASGTEEVTNSISGVNEAAAETGSAALQVLSAASSLTEEAATLRREVEEFIATIRAA